MDSYFSVRVYEARNAKKVLFFFPAGFTQMWHYRWTVFLLNRMGVTVVGFNFAWKRAIRKCNFDQLLQLIYQVDQKVNEIIKAYPPKIEYSTLGISFGSVLALYTAKKQDNINIIILFVPYGTLSNLLWTHKPSQPFIETLIKGGLKTEADLDKLTEPVETRHDIEKLEGRKVISFRGMSDKIVFDGEKIESAIKQSEIDSTLYRLRFGHFGTSVVGLLQKRKWMRIL